MEMEKARFLINYFPILILAFFALQDIMVKAQSFKSQWYTREH